MRYQGFCGPSNPSQSILADCERSVNFFLERIEAGAAPFDLALYPTPGQFPWIRTTDVSTRAIEEVSGRTFAVVGGGFWELFPLTQGATRRGAVSQDANPATISYNGKAGSQVFITSGNNGYLYDLAANTLTLVLTDEATMGGFASGRFLAFNAKTGRVRASNQNDGLTWDPSVWFARGQAPDPWLSMIVSEPEIWMIGDRTGEVWYDTGAYPQPFAPYPGAVFQFGTAAPFAATKVGDAITWLAKDKNDTGMIVAAKGYTPQVISNFAVAHALSGYQRTATLADAECLVYEQAGHRFAAYSFESAHATWVYDFTMGTWHERGTWNSVAGRWDAWSARVHGYAAGRHLVGCRATGVISILDAIYGDDNGTPIRRLRIPPPVAAKPPRRLTVDRFELFLEPGLAPAAGLGSDPVVMLRVSKNAKTWSSERTVKAGKQGQFDWSVVWNRLGSSDRLWVPEVSMTDPIPWRLLGADVVAG